ncbi:hypothetical protein VNO77_32772 [Canavalia gladiata]|uniref:Probable small nuclear ribonucleoprotein G n=1 Tax=Canavalia gladiata TaxID=3824 RepID=A0AAN9KQ52_CANGL
MAVSDAVVSNLTTVYVAIIACIKVYGFLCGRSFSGGFVLLVSTTVVALILVATLTWDVSRKATYAFAGDQPQLQQQHVHEVCKGGICWHGVAVRSPASQVRFRLPQHLPYTAFVLDLDPSGRSGRRSDVCFGFILLGVELHNESSVDQVDDSFTQLHFIHYVLFGLSKSEGFGGEVEVFRYFHTKSSSSFVVRWSHLITMSRSGQPPDLKKYMDKKLQIKLNANRMIVGTLRGFDQFMNLVVDNTVEVNGNEKNEIGMVVIRGNSVVTVEALEPVNRT